MLKKTIEFENPFTGERQKKDYYFHISKGQLARLKLESELNGGLDQMLQEMIAKKDGKTIMDTVEKIILMASGERVGDTFDQSPEAVTRFRNSPAFDELFLELCTSATACAEFIAGAIPSNLRNQLPDDAFEQAGIKKVELPHALQTETDNRTHPGPQAAPAFELGPVEAKNEPVSEISLGDVLKMPPVELASLLASPSDKAQKVVAIVQGMSNDEFQRLLGRFSGGNIPRVLLKMALQRD